MVIPLGELTAIIERNHLVLRYALANQTGDPIYVLNQMRGADGAPFSTERAFVCHEDGDTALFFQGPPPLAQDRPGPSATRVDPGGTLGGAVRVPLPLLEWHAGAPTRPDATCQVLTIQRARLRISFARAAESRVTPSRDMPEVFDVASPAFHCFESTTVLPAPCELRRRLDDFLRFA